MFRCLKRGPGFYGYLWRLTGPIALQNLITFSLGLIDTLMVSWLGNTQMAAVTTANVPVFLLISIVFGVQSGLGILVSQYWGKKDMESISRAIGVAAMLGTGITLVLAVVLFLWPVQIMDLLSNKHELSVLGAPYLKLIGFSYVFNMLSSIYVSAMRSAENSGFGMKLFGVSTLLNTGMNYILIFGKCGFPALGIQGAAIATLLSRVAEFLICLVCALRSRILPLDLAAFFRPGWEMLRRFVKYSTPVILNETAWGLGNILLTVILGYTDNSVEMLAANAVMGNLNRLFLVVCFGLGAATAVMVGKAIGEGQSHREVMDLSRTLLVFTLLVGTGLAAVSLALVPTLFVPVVFRLFKLTGQSAAIAADVDDEAVAARHVEHHLVEVGVAHALLERLVAQVADVVVEDGVVRAACDEIVGAEIAAQQGVAEVGGVVLLPAPVAPRVEGRVEVDMAVAELRNHLGHHLKLLALAHLRVHPHGIFFVYGIPVHAFLLEETVVLVQDPPQGFEIALRVVVVGVVVNTRRGGEQQEE